MGKEFDVIVVGNYWMDLIFSGVEELPRLGQETFCQGFTMLPGGSYTTVAAMKRLGIHVGWACDFGNDEVSKYIIAQCEREQLDASLFIHFKHPIRRVTVSLSNPKDRAFVSYTDPEPALPSGFKALFTQRAKAYFIPGLFYGNEMILGSLIAKAKGMALMMDGNSSRETLQDTPAIKKALACLDLFLPNAGEARRLTGKQNLQEAMAVLGDYCPLVVVKDGAQGSHALYKQKYTSMPSLPVTPVDTTGAGDCFNAGFIKAWMEQRPIEDCLQWGNIVGGLSTQAIGGSGYCVTLDEVHHTLRKFYGH